MPKYYVSTGEVKKVIDSPDAKTAVIDVFKSLDSENLGFITVTSEKGFDANDPDDLVWLTMNLLEEVDKLGDYKSEDWF